MALTKEQFRSAIGYLRQTDALSSIGVIFLDANNQRVLDEGDNNADITPNDTILNQALVDFAEQQVNEEAQENIRSEARAQVQNIPNWATWTEVETLDHIDTNVTDLASAKVVIRAMARMLIALRNERWPDLEGN